MYFTPQLVCRNSSAALMLDLLRRSRFQSPSRQKTCLVKFFAIFISPLLSSLQVIKYRFSFFYKCFCSFHYIFSGKTFAEFFHFGLKSVYTICEACIHAP